MSRLIVQIGHYKCGTSSLQRRLADNRQWLRERGLVYPDLGVLIDPGAREIPSHSALVFEMLRTRGAPGPAWYRDALARTPEPPSFESMVERLHDALDSADGRDVILSSEEFMRFGESDRMDGLVDEFAEIIAGHDVTIFCYLRRHDLYLASWYNQLVKMGGLAQNLSQNLDRYLPGVHVDYARGLRPWVQRFGADHVVVRRYEARVGDVAEDFLRHVGHEPRFPDGTEVWENARFPDAFIETLRHWNHLHAPTGATARLKQIMVEEAGGQAMAGVVVDVLDADARRRLHDAAVASDAQLCALLGLEHTLFDDLDRILEPIPNSISDIAAARRFGGRTLARLLVDTEGTPIEAHPEPPPPPSTLRSTIRRGAGALGRRLHAGRLIARLRNRSGGEE